jgi:hypothetical protein
MINSYAGRNWVGSRVITDRGDLFGWVRKIRFIGNRGFLVIVSTPLLFLPQKLMSICELPVTEVISFDGIALTVTQNSLEVITDISTGLLSKLGIFRAPWSSIPVASDKTYYVVDDDYDDDFGTSRVPVSRPPTPSPLEGEISF